MNSLPGELIEQICGLLKEDAPETLRAVILINRKWYQVAEPHFYATFCATLEVRFIGLVGLQAIVAECTESGLGRPYLAHARKLVIITVEKGMDYWDLPAAKYWEPLLSLVTRLNNLKELHWEVDGMFPRCLLDAINEHHPGCGISFTQPEITGVR